MRPVSFCTLIGAAGVALLASCASSGTMSKAPTAAAGGNCAASDSMLAEQKARIDALDGQLRQCQADTQAAQSAAAAALEKARSSELFPPDAEPGHCYARVITAPPTETTTETVVVREASEKIEIVPAVYEDAAEQVLVKEATKRLEIVPAVYETRSDEVVVKPAGKKLVKIPPTYKTVTEQVLVRPAYTSWKRGPAGTPVATLAGGGKVLESQTVGTGEVMCLVEVPAEYKTVSRTVLDQPGRTNEVEVPAQTVRVSKQVMKTPASTREVEVPAVYKTVKVRKLVKPAEERRTPVPAVTQQVTKSVVKGEPKLSWASVLCDVNATRTNVAAIQSKLRVAGYYRGEANGAMGHGTMEAVNKYARDKGLPYGQNFIAIDVVKSLGLKL
ncbi:MAG: peptidoglycan-binding domain-containing protein [Steroidobacteraceae bacterium]